MGRKKLPVWAVVAADSRFPRDGRYIEDLGRYYPVEEPARVELNNERLLHWLEVGAQPSDTVRSLLSKEGLLMEHHMRLKGKSEAEIQQAVEAHRTAQAEKAAQNTKLTPAARRKLALEEEKKLAAKAEAEAAKARAEAEAKAKEEAEAARKAAAEERAQKEAEARAEAEAKAAEAAAEPEAEATAESEASTEAVAPAEAVIDAPTEDATEPVAPAEAVIETTAEEVDAGAESEVSEQAVKEEASDDEKEA